MLRIKEYDYFAPHYYALLPGFRYITDDRYDELSDEMREIVRTGAWYKGPGSEWPLKTDDEHLLDKDFHNIVALEMDAEQMPGAWMLEPPQYPFTSSGISLAWRL